MLALLGLAASACVFLSQLAPAASLAILPSQTPTDTPIPPAPSPSPTPTPAPATATPSPTPTPTLPKPDWQLLTIPAPSLANNLVGEKPEQTILVYLPPSYAASKQRYPLILYLTGFDNSVKDYPALNINAIDALMREGRINEMILVAASGKNLYGGSFYVNSPVTGNWEDFVVKDLIGYIDSHYRTINLRAARGIAGHSMGGFGALNLGMHHPDVFGAVYSISPGLLAAGGLGEIHMFSNEGSVRNYLNMEKLLVDLARPQAFQKLIKMLPTLDSDQLFTLAYGSAFAPDAVKNAPYIDYPYHKEDSSRLLNKAIWNKWENGLGGADEKVQKYRTNLLALYGLVIEYGTDDEYKWLPAGCEYYGKVLRQAGIPVQVRSFAGAHTDRLQERILQHMLPFFSQTLNGGAAASEN